MDEYKCVWVYESTWVGMGDYEYVGLGMSGYDCEWVGMGGYECKSVMGLGVFECVWFSMRG